jgi:predicted choloylglycine hydrolase
VIHVQEIKFKGSYYDIGYNNGKYLIPEKENGFPPKFSQEFLEKSKAYEKVVKDYCPGLLDEMQGMAESSGVDYQELVTFEITPFRIPTQCLNIAIAGKHTKSGKPLFVRNHEWLEEDDKNLRVVTTHPKGKLASYGFTFHWPLLSRYGGTNEAGLTLSSAAGTFHCNKPGIMLNVAMRWILDNFKTTEEAVEFLEAMPKVWGVNYLLIDKNNAIAKLETHPENTVVTYPDNGFDMTTMYFEHEDMKKYKQDQPGVVKYCESRRKFLDKWFAENKGNITEDSIIEILKNCDNPLHYHDKAPNGTYGTCWSWMISPMEKDAFISTGPPCKNEFKSYTIDYTFT